MAAKPAVHLIEQAFQELEKCATPIDARTFRNTTLGDVRKAALQLEKQLEARQASCNMRRLEPLFNSLEHYSKPLEVLCNGTPYLPWIWAPIKLILQVRVVEPCSQQLVTRRRLTVQSKVASEYIEAFKQIIKGYSQIADVLPRFDRLNDAFRTVPEFQHVLAAFYVDIVRFHKEAYKMIKRSRQYPM